MSDDDGFDSRPIRVINGGHHLVVWLLAVLFVGAGVAYVTRAPATPAGCTYESTLMDRGTRLAQKAGLAIHSLNGPVPTAKISDTARGTWRTLGFWAGTFGAAVQGRTAPVTAPIPCGGVQQCSPTPGGQAPPNPASLAATISVAPHGTSEFSAEQMSVAGAAIRVAQQRHLPVQAEVVILAAGFQESGVRNLNYGDKDSLGWLQQRASWGSVAQRRNPAVAAGKFYDHLVRIPGWQSMPVTVAAQRVQISGFPNAYAQWEGNARRLIAAVGQPPALAAPSPPAPQCPSPAAHPPVSQPAAVTPPGWNFAGNNTVDQAVSYMSTMAQRRTSIQSGMCLHYVGVAYGHQGTGQARAIDVWNTMPSQYRHPGMSPPPRGALVLWHTGNPAGHIAISLGNGQIASTDFDGIRYHAGIIGVGPISAIDRWGPRVGWTPPIFLGLTKVGTTNA